MYHQLIVPVLLAFFYALPSFANDLWVDAVHGDDTQNGATAETAIKTLQAAMPLVTPGTIVHIQPGIYRESVKPRCGEGDASVVYLAEQGQASVKIRGSIPANHLNWQAVTESEFNFPNPEALLWADVSAWQLSETPRFIVQTDSNSNIQQRLPIAREPDWKVKTSWKYHEFWWEAEGAQVEGIDTFSATKLSDRRSSENTDIEAGNLTTLGDLTGATLVAMDAQNGESVYRRKIIQHEKLIGRVTIDQPATFANYLNSDNPGLGWGSKFYVENHPALLDSPGEYWLDVNTQRLYLFPPETGIDNLEISVRDYGWDLTSCSTIALQGLNIEFYNQAAIYIRNQNDQVSHYNYLSHLHLSHANYGLWVEAPIYLSNSTVGLTLTYSEIAHMDTSGVYLSNRAGEPLDNNTFEQTPIVDTKIENSEFHHLGFRAERDNAAGLDFVVPNEIQVNHNYIHDTAHEGMSFFLSVIQSDKQNEFTHDEIKTGNILVSNNLVEHTCQAVGNCGAVKFSGVPPRNHVFKNTLLYGNTLRHTPAWSHIAEKRGLWAEGLFGFGLRLTYATGLHIYRNQMYDNSWAGLGAFHTWRDGVMLIYNNLFADNWFGMSLWNRSELDRDLTVDTQIANNIIFNNERYGIQHTESIDSQRLLADYNVYFDNGWSIDAENDGILNVLRDRRYAELDTIQQKTPWEANSLQAYPGFVAYDSQQPDFHLTSSSPAIDRGVGSFPTSLNDLLNQFEVKDNVMVGDSWDIGPYEFLSDQALAINLQTSRALTTSSRFVTTITTSIGQSGNRLTLSQTEQVNIIGNMQVDPYDQGKEADLIVVGQYTPPKGNTVFFIRRGQQWTDWDANLSNLIVAEHYARLPSTISLDLFEGNFSNFTGEFIGYVGYVLSDNVLVFNGQYPIKFNVE